MNLRRATKGEIFKYGFGGLGSNIPFLLMMSYSLVFYTDVFGINAFVVGTIFLTARLVDAFTDPLMGMIADKTRSKIGRYRPWIKYVAPIMGIFTFLVFYTPNIAPTAKIVYAFITYILYSIFSTMVNIPYHALTAEMSDDPDQRTTIAIVKQSFIIPAMIFASILVLPVVNALGGGSTAWAIYSAFLGVLTTLSFWLCQSGAKNHDIITPDENNEIEKVKFSDQLKLIYKNQPLLMLLIAAVTDMIAFAAANAVNVYFFKNYLGREDLVPIAMSMSLMAMFIVLPTLQPLSKKLGKKVTYYSTTLITTIIYVLWFILGGKEAPIPLHLFFAFITTTVGFIPGVLAWSMVADCVDYGEWKTGTRGAGTVTALLPFVNKVGMALGGFIIGYILSKSGYIAPINNVEQVQPESALFAIKSTKLLFPVFGYIASLISMWFYKLDKKTTIQMNEELSARR